MDFKNKRIVITGATSGIGQQLMFMLSRHEGTKIIAVGRRLRNVPIAMDILPFKADVSQKEDIDALFDFAVKKLGGIDMFISNAGYVYTQTHKHANWEDFENIFKTNVLSNIYITKKMLDLHLDSDKEFYVAITVSSMAKLHLPSNPVYVSTKSALDGFIKNVRYEFPANGHISGIYPAAVKSANLFENSMAKTTTNILTASAQTPGEVAKAIIKGIRKNKKTIYTRFSLRFKVFLFNAFPFIFNNYAKRLYFKRKDTDPQVIL